MNVEAAVRMNVPRVKSLVKTDASIAFAEKNAANLARPAGRSACGDVLTRFVPSCVASHATERRVTDRARNSYLVDIYA